MKKDRSLFSLHLIGTLAFFNRTATTHNSVAVFSLLFPVIYLLLGQVWSGAEHGQKRAAQEDRVTTALVQGQDQATKKRVTSFGQRLGADVLDKFAIIREEAEESLLSDLNALVAPPAQTTTIETLPAGTWIIAMDEALQDGSSSRVRQAYGLAVHLLHANVPLKWIIDPNKANRNSIDFSASARLRFPSTSGYSSRSFRTGPLAIFPGFEAQAQSVINSYGNSIRVYELQNATSVPVNSTLSHKPKVLVEEEKNPNIHTDILSAAGLDAGTHYNEGPLTSVTATSCVTVITVPHNDAIDNAQRTSIRNFLRNGGNFLAQCAAVRAFQDNSPSTFTNAGFVDEPGLGTFLYDNPQEPSAQFEGTISDEGGSLTDFAFQNDPPGGTRIVHDSDNDFKAYTGRIDGFSADAGGYVHYLGGHKYGGDIDADRYYLNAVLRSADRPENCGLSIPLVDANDDTGTIDCGGASVTVNVLANDDNPQNNPLTVTLIGSGSNGTFVNNNNGTITYTGNVNGFWGGDQITYELCDASICDQATITITSNNPNQVTINGTVFEDSNTNGVLDGGESGPSGVTVNLYQDSNGNGSRDGGEPLLQSTATTSGGQYSLLTNSLAKLVIEVNASTLPANPSFTTDNVEVADFSALGQLDCNNNFGFVSCPVLPNAGSDGSTVICEGVSPSVINLFNFITGEDTGGTWTETTTGPNSGVTIGSGTSVNFGSTSPGVYEFTYTVTATNCPTDVATATITVPTIVEVTLDSKTDATCNAAADGTINISVSGGTPGYTYAWSDGSNAEDRTGLAADTYTVTATDANGCTATLTETVGEASDVVATASLTSVSCAGGSDGSILVTATGTVPPFNVSWTGPSNGDPAGDEIAVSGGSYTITALTSGSYTITITDVDGCTATIIRNVTQPAPLAAVASATNILCFGQTGSISLSVTGGTGAKTFSWSGPNSFTAATRNISGLAAGTYNVTVTDINNCTTTASATVNGPTTAVSIAVNSTTDVSCDGSSGGDINIAASGGTPGYTYQWSDGPTAEDRTGLSPGNYTVIATDANGCTAELTVAINQEPDINLTLQVQQPLCPPTPMSPLGDGAIDLTVTGGESPFTFSWSTSNGSGLSTASEDQTGLSEGTYTVVVTDANGCSKSIAATLEYENGLPVAPNNVNN
jgi:hypothetical protein